MTRKHRISALVTSLVGKAESLGCLIEVVSNVASVTIPISLYLFWNIQTTRSDLTEDVWASRCVRNAFLCL
ncbi:hypothetical protein BDZ97DRAFT_1798464 [Flammula alnicola]|nr:hypothetical protein BDZ97DRAFT_1798380 [Flammula alnicola]KAF8968857.1 hypothetical protein BDZ97DRAFT_1798464 [Flammula alnicola]